MRSVRKYLISGLLFTLPVGLTIWFLVAVVAWVDGAFRKFFGFFFRDSPLFGDEYVFGFSLVIVLLLLLGIGWLATNVMGKLLRLWIDTLFDSVPLVNKIYHFVKQVTSSLSKGGGTAFKRVVLVQYPHPKIHAIGFVSNENFHYAGLGDKGGRKLVVFVPTAPNPTSGFVLVVDEADCIPLEMPVEDGLKFIISGGTLDLAENGTILEAPD
jgi:uncharacterized membrane protein